ncbi:hypothetical protein MSG_01456 [Mycobacterium shigaense]|uniref:Uncharacterized protein n=1 Tax=Mycobacterium shigaense TaxID=722731 RepID=A0A1Z4EF79_9MYCO|nr:hypothetical protein MSG_01456 [Mycobacterium shigaense]
MLSPYDYFPIHRLGRADRPPASAVPNHYDRYWFNGHGRGGYRF